jgi:branched-chain amino acid transport system ATP-binding protein
MLKVKGLCAYYGAIEALSDVSLELPPSDIRCIIGANGAGKSTLLKAISGMVAKTGSISWDGVEISKTLPKKIAKLGIAHVPEGRHVFPGLTVYENLEVGSVSWHGFFGGKPYDKDIESVFSIFPRLKERRHQKAWSLSGGEQQMLAIGRALMSRPRLLLLDEPSMGLAPLVVEELFRQIIRIHEEENIPILLIEQNAKLALKVSSYAYILEHGKVAFEGASEKLQGDARVIKAYLGELAKAE